MSLTYEQVADYVSRLVYKPDWLIRCEARSSDMVPVKPGRAWITVEWSVKNSTDAPHYSRYLAYPFADGFYVYCDEIPTEAHLARVILEHAIHMEAEGMFHESREFLRVKTDKLETYTDGYGGHYEIDEGQWFAPFHPHNPLGNDLWAATHSMRVDGAHNYLPDGS